MRADRPPRSNDTKAVAPEAQRRGVGSRLVIAAADAARNGGARRLTLNVLATNEAARRLYDRCGFAVEGIQQQQFYLGGRYVDDMQLALDLARDEPPRDGFTPTSGRGVRPGPT